MKDHKATRSILSSIERTQLALEQSRDIISTHTLDDFSHTSVNGAITEVLGYSKEELMGRSTFELWHPDDIARIRTEDILKGQSIVGKLVQYRLRHKDGHYLHFEGNRRRIRDPQSNEVVELLCVSRDVTDRVLAEQKNAQLATVVESSSDFVLFFSPRNCLTYANRSAAAYFSIDKQSVTEKSLHDIFDNAIVPALMDAKAVALQEGRWQGALEYSEFGAASTLLIREINYHQEGSDGYFSLTAQDISLQRGAEMAKKQYMEQLASMSRLLEAEEMGSQLAHELNQPIAAITNYCYGILQNDALSDVALSEHALTQIQVQAERASDIIKRVRSLRGKTPYQLGDFDLADCLLGITSLVKKELEDHSIVLRVAIDEQARITADRIQIELLLGNVLKNAIESLARSDSTNREIFASVRCDEASDKVTIDVVDNGQGIVQGDKDKVFEPYFSSKQHSLGIGLSVCKSIVEAHKGRIQLLPNAGGGVSVSITLPRKQEH